MNRVSAIVEQTPSVETPRAAPITELVGGIISDTQTLIQQQFAMLRAETTAHVRQAACAARVVMAGGALITVGVLLVMMGSVYLLNHLLPGMPLWACWMIVGVPLLGLGIATWLIGWQQLSAITPMPEKTLKTFQENVTWIANHRN